MKSKKTVLIILLAFVLVLGGASMLYNRLGGNLAPEQLTEQAPQASEPVSDDSTGAGESEPEKMLAPDFPVFDLDGNAVHLSDFMGKPIILNFWASWCGPCKIEMPDFHEKYLEVGNDIHFLMINMTDGSRETVDSASKFIADQEYTFPVFYDTESDASAAATYRAYSLPTTFFIDAEGYVIAQAIGAINADTLQKGIDMILPK